MSISQAMEPFRFSRQIQYSSQQMQASKEMLYKHAYILPELSLSNIRKITSKLLLLRYSESATLVEPACAVFCFSQNDYKIHTKIYVNP